MAVSEQRLTLFALISEFEADVREQIATYICPDHSIKDDLGPDAFQILKDRAEKNLLIDETSEPPLLIFLDIGDAIKIILSNRSLLPSELAASYNKNSKQIDKIPSIRNRVMHQRPLEFDDLPYTTETLRNLAKNSKSYFKRISSVFKSLSDGNLQSQYASIFAYEREPTVLNNLPQPDFEDTGFMGRRGQVEELKKAILGPFPVITVLGVGGAGKSALALHVAYDILNDDTSTFDAIIWTSAKTTRLTGSDVQEISGAISTSVGVAEAALRELGSDVKPDPFLEIRTYLENFKILLFIDNLETILDEKMRNFVRSIPQGSKVVFTSRIGLGAYDFVIPVENLDPKEASVYLRRVASVWNLSDIAQLPNDVILGYCKRLNFSPLGIKWFIQAISTGASPQRLLAYPEELLRFCLENIIDKLSETSRNILFALAITGREQSPASLHFLTNIEPWAVQDGLRELISCHLTSVIVSKFGEEDRYRISTIAQTYIARILTPKAVIQKDISDKQLQLNAIAERATTDQTIGYNYDPAYIFIRPEFAGTDAVAASFLRRALIAVRDQRWDDAFGEVEAAKDVAPTYFEVLRVEAHVSSSRGNVMRAKSAFDEAIALKDDYPPLSFHYSNFLIKSLSDGPSSEAVILKALVYDPDSATLKLELSRSYLYQAKYSDCHKTLDSIDRNTLQSARMVRMFWDINIQSCTRCAERLLANGATVDAAETISKLDDIIKYIPPESVDAQIRENLIKGFGICKRIILSEGKVVSAQADKSRSTMSLISSFLRLPDAEANDADPTASPGRLGGKICYLPVGKPFGFLESDNGERLFFHRKNFIVKSDFDIIQVGDSIKFSLGYNNQGACADEVSIVVN